MIVRQATLEDAAAIGRIYYDTIHFVNPRDYSARQIEAWSPPGCEQAAGWERKQGNRLTVVCESDGRVIGFGELEPNGHIDCFYVHHETQRQGVGRRILAEIEAIATTRGDSRLFVEASITAWPFFTALGYATLCQQTVTIRGIELINYRMEKWLRGEKTDKHDL